MKSPWFKNQNIASLVVIAERYREQVRNATELYYRKTLTLTPEWTGGPK